MFSPFFVFSIMVILVVFLCATVFEAVAMWKVYVKAGKPGWAALIPLYNTCVMAEIAGKPNWWGLYPLLVLIPVIGAIASLVVSIILALGVARNFGKSDTFGFFGLWLFNAIGIPILGFGPAVYMPNEQPPTTPTVA